MRWEDFEVLPLNFAALKIVLPKLEELEKLEEVDERQLDLIGDIIYVALQRNNPELSKAELLEQLDMHNSAALLAKIMELSFGVKK